MALDNRKNFSKAVTTTLHTDLQTTITLNASEGAKLPDPAVRNYNITWFNLTDFPDPSDDPNVEIVRVTAKVGDVLTVVRGQEGIAATTKNTASKTYQFSLAETAKFADDIEVEIQQGTLNYAIGTGTANAHVLTLDPVPTAYVDGASYKFKAVASNTDEVVTMNINGLGVKGIRNSAGFSNFLVGDIKIGLIYEIVYIGSNDVFVLLSNNVDTASLSINAWDFATAVYSADDYSLTFPKTHEGAGQKAFAGSVVRFKATDANTGAVTVTINTLTDNVTKKDGAALVAGDIKAGDIIEIVRITTAGDFQLVSAGVTAITNDEISDTVADGITSATPVVVSNMTKTFNATEAGDWMLYFSGWAWSNDKNNNSYYGIYKNGVLIGHTERAHDAKAITTKAEKFAKPMYTQAKISVVNADIITIQAYTDVGTFTVDNRSMNFLKVG